jgi:3-oxoacyl-[acyl-carrier protein] reductase
MSVEGKVALVTGASRGIGRAIALDLARAGAMVVGTATTQAGADKIGDYLAAEKVQGRGLVLDVSDLDSIDACLHALKASHGPAQILVNNAAITRDNLMLRMKADEWNQVIDTNLNAVFRMSKACLRDMVKARWGRIISIGSVVGSTGNLGQANYAAAKAAVVGFSKALAYEVAKRGITVNVVAPGFVETDMTQALSEEQKQALLLQIPMGRIASPEEIAGVVSFLASDQATYMTGQTLHANGGMYMV